MPAKVTKRLLRIAGVLLVLLILAMITGFQPIYWIVYLVVAGTAIGYMWAWIQSRGLETQVQEGSRHPQVGQTVHLKVSVKEKWGMPRIGIRARLLGDFATLEDEDFSLTPRGTTTWTVSAPCRRRGMNSLGSLAIVSTDPSGLVRLECRVGQPQGVLVYPRTVELTRVLVRGQATGGELGEAGHLTGHSPAVSNVRKYVAGDSLTHIHWATTARLDQLMTKEFEGAGINEVWLFVDLYGPAQVGTGDDGTEEHSIAIAASLAKGLIDEGHSVGLVAHGDQYYRFPPGRDVNHLWSMLKGLALARATGTVPMSSLISRESGDLGGGTVAMVIGPWPGERASRVFQFLTRRGILVVPIFLDVTSFGAPLSDSRRVESQDWAFLIKRGDELSLPLGNVLDRLASY